MAPHARFPRVAGHPALDFVNTVDWRGDPRRREDRLGDFPDLVRWARQAALVSAAEARVLGAAAGRDPRSAGRAIQRARRLREVLGRIFAARGGGRRPAVRDLRHFNAFLGAALRRRRLEPRGDRCDWGWVALDDRRLDAFLSPLVLAAADLLTSPRQARIRACAADGCGWLFLDTSRGGRRRWCSMQSCGNRAKARRFHARATRRRCAPQDIAARRGRRGACRADPTPTA